MFADHVVGNLSVFFNEDQCKLIKAWKTSEFELEIDSTKKKYLCKKQKLYEKTVDSQTVGYGQMIL